MLHHEIFYISGLALSQTSCKSVGSLTYASILSGFRTVKTDEDMIQRDTHERTITISGAADETEIDP